MNDGLALLLLVVTLVCAGGGLAIGVVLLRGRGAEAQAERILREELAQSRAEAQGAARETRAELSTGMARIEQSLLAQLTTVATVQNNQIDSFAKSLTELNASNEKRLIDLRDMVEGRLKEIRNVVEGRLEALQKDNAEKLEKMRQTVDEKLHATLEQRLGESFKLVSDKLESVQRGLGEMQSLAADVGGLKRVLSNVKDRGGWGEVQLGTLIDQLLTRDQYEKNVATRPRSDNRVEFAIRLPGAGEGGTVWLPIDSKFPLEDYQRMLAAQEQADTAGVEEAGRAIETRIRLEAKSIREKYVEPPYTTDFALLFLPTEGLYAEVLRRPGLTDLLQREYRVTVVGPTTLTALLNSLQMGFRTLAIERRSSEVWQVLGAVKTEFGKFGEVLARTKAQLLTVTNSIESAETRTRQMERKLKGVEALPGPEAAQLLGGTDARDEDGPV